MTKTYTSNRISFIVLPQGQWQL